MSMRMSVPRLSAVWARRFIVDVVRRVFAQLDEIVVVYGTAPPFSSGTVPWVGVHANTVGFVNPALWTTVLPGSTRTVNKNHDEQTAFFGEVTIGLTQKLDLTLGVQYQLNDDIMIYGSWSEGFTDANIQINNLPIIAPGGCPATVNVAIPSPLDREVVTSREIGFRSDSLDSTLRFNASYFDADWGGMRVATLATDPCSGGSTRARSGATTSRSWARRARSAPASTSGSS